MKPRAEKTPAADTPRGAKAVGSDMHKKGRGSANKKPVQHRGPERMARRRKRPGQRKRPVRAFSRRRKNARSLVKKFARTRPRVEESASSRTQELSHRIAPLG